LERVVNELPDTDERNLIVQFVRSSARGIVRGNLEG
jgi:UDP-N-acetylglucosamine acyltransferase